MERLKNSKGMRGELTIWQQNLNKSHTGQHDLISSGKLAELNIDIIALQEPSINFLGKTIASRDWTPIYPSTHKKEPKKTRTVTLMRSNLPTESWEQVEFQSGDVTAVKISGEWGKLIIFNIYNDCHHDRTIHELTKFHRDNHKMWMEGGSEDQAHHLMWVGDFNRHHPAWDNLEDDRLFTSDTLAAAETLIMTLAELGLDSALAAGVPTHVHNVTKKWTRLDQVFVTEHTMDMVMVCEMHHKDRGLNTDHIPIISQLDVTLGRTLEQKTNNFRDINWDNFRKTLEERMSKFGIPKRIGSQETLNCECDKLTMALQEMIA